MANGKYVGSAGDILAIINAAQRPAMQERAQREEQTFRAGLTQWHQHAEMAREDAARQFQVLREEVGAIRKQEEALDEKLSNYGLMAEAPDKSKGYLKLVGNVMKNLYGQKRTLATQRADREANMQLLDEFQGRIAEKRATLNRFSKGFSSTLVDDLIAEANPPAGGAPAQGITPDWRREYGAIRSFVFDADEQKAARERWSQGTPEQQAIASDDVAWKGAVESARRRLTAYMEPALKYQDVMASRARTSEMFQMRQLQKTLADRPNESEERAAIIRQWRAWTAGMEGATPPNMTALNWALGRKPTPKSDAAELLYNQLYDQWDRPKRLALDPDENQRLWQKKHSEYERMVEDAISEAKAEDIEPRNVAQILEGQETTQEMPEMLRLMLQFGEQYDGGDVSTLQDTISTEQMEDAYNRMPSGSGMRDMTRRQNRRLERTYRKQNRLYDEIGSQ